MFRIASILIALMMISACTAKVKGPEAEISSPNVTIGSGASESGFCPPGQAKKGRC